MVFYKEPNDKAMYTIIIPTHERHDVLRRSIDYYRNFDCHIFVADSSPKKIDDEFPDNVIYKHLPEFGFISDSGIGFAEKILEVAKTITTPYVCISPDDDFLLESSLKTGARFLDDNLDYVSVQGRYLGFELIEGRVVFSPRYARYSSQYAVEDEDSLSRVVRTFNPYMHQVFSIQRTELFIRSYQLCTGVSSVRMMEILALLIPMCHGKHKVLPILWMARDRHMFDPVRSLKKLKTGESENTITGLYKKYNEEVNKYKKYLDSEECRLVRKKFKNSVSGLIGENNESDKIFNAAYKSFMKYLIAVRNEGIIKKILRIFIPAGMVNHIKAYKESQVLGGAEETSSSKNFIEEVRRSILKFLKCYE
tara:strand:+ start:449 stop:1543 length:1095 start_codon:yes stop_codon:yes gene_type:complete